MAVRSCITNTRSLFRSHNQTILSRGTLPHTYNTTFTTCTARPTSFRNINFASTCKTHVSEFHRVQKTYVKGLTHFYSSVSSSSPIAFRRFFVLAAPKKIMSLGSSSQANYSSTQSSAPLRDYSTSLNSDSGSVKSTNSKMSGSLANSTDPARPEYERWSWKWWREWTIIFIVFGITGSTTVRVVRPLVVHILGIDGTFKDGPWSYRFAYLCITLPLYSVILYGVGTLAGRQAYFKRIISRMWGRLIPTRLINRIRFTGTRGGGGSNGV